MTVTDKAPAEAGLTRPWPADQVERWPIERLAVGLDMAYRGSDPPGTVSSNPSLPPAESRLQTGPAGR